nr:MAG TPA: hypothetical protein [Bacteriophage sp.]DAX76768.1 MAG TPA: hypothetical protein [Caudoviricetes sp.]
MQDSKKDTVSNRGVRNDSAHLIFLHERYTPKS